MPEFENKCMNKKVWQKQILSFPLPVFLDVSGLIFFHEKVDFRDASWIPQAGFSLHIRE